ncbi:MAG: phosphate/phosphite/phosphonate ABC transporter substrate-binding protein [Alkalispirochaetaceae bacterium]
MKKLSFLLLLSFLAAGPLFAAGQAEAPMLGTEENPIVWALVPSGETQQIVAGADDFARMLEEETGYAFETVVATDYAGVIEALASDPPEAHMTALNTFGAILAAERGVAEVALVAVRYGRPFYDGQILAHRDAGIETIADLAGKSFARPDPNSTSGWIVPSIVMAAAGVDAPEELAEVLDAGGHGGVVSAIYSGSADAGSTFIDARDGVEEDFADVKDVVVKIDEFGPIPNDGIQYSTMMDPDMRENITEAFLRLMETEEGAAAMESVYEWTEVIEQTDSFYDPFRQVLQASGLDLQTFIE